MRRALCDCNPDTTVVRSKGGGGSYLHAVLALDGEDDTVLGLIDAQFLERSRGRREDRRQAGIEDKQSFRWLQGVDQAASICAAAACVTVVADRESDISRCSRCARKVANWWSGPLMTGPFRAASKAVAKGL